MQRKISFGMRYGGLRVTKDTGAGTVPKQVDGRSSASHVKFSDEVVLAVMADCLSGMSRRAAAQKHGVPQFSVKQWMQGTARSHLLSEAQRAAARARGEDC